MSIESERGSRRCLVRAAQDAGGVPSACDRLQRAGQPASVTATASDGRNVEAQSMRAESPLCHAHACKKRRLCSVGMQKPAIQAYRFKHIDSSSRPHMPNIKHGQT
eukprot:162309-Chlamydomonas_euryale.AAC.1